MKFNKHIVWITPGFAKSELDSTTIPSMQALALEFKRANPEATLEIVTIHFPFQTHSYSWNDIPVHCVGGQNARYPKRFVVWRRVLKRLAEIHSIDPIDVLHSFWYSESALLADLFCKRTSILHVCSIMGQDAHKKNRYFRFINSKRIVKVAISNRNAESFLEASGVRADFIIPIGIEPLVLEVTTTRQIDVIGVGSLLKAKRFDMFLRIIKRVSLVLPNVKVLLAGDGPEKESLVEYARNNGLLDNVRFVGMVQRSEVLVAMTQSKILLHTSNAEGMGYIFLEAAACGCYVAATPIGIVAQDQFTLVSQNEEILAEQIIQWLETETENESRYPYLLENTAREYVNLYDNKR